MVNLIPDSIKIQIPDTELALLKAILDSLTVFAFIILIIVVFYARNRYPVLKRNNVFRPLISFTFLGLISSFMDAIDEWIWFLEPEYYYNEVWKPTRIFLFLIAIFLLVLTFNRFYKFSKRLIGE